MWNKVFFLHPEHYKMKKDMDVSIKNNTAEVLELAQWVVGRKSIEALSHLERLHKKGYPRTVFENQCIEKANTSVLVVRIEFTDGILYTAHLKKRCLYSMLTINNEEDTNKIYALCKQRYTPFMDKYWLNRNIQISFIRRNNLQAINFNEVLYTEFTNEESIFTNRNVN